MIRVGLVDDQELIRQGIAGLLQLSGKTQVSWQAQQGLDALEKIHKQPVDVLISDIRMPEMDGIALVKRLRSEGNKTPVLMLTTFEDKDLLVKSLEAGANGFLLKDISLDKLVDTLEKIKADGFLAEPMMLKAMQPEQKEIAAKHIQLSDREIQILKYMVGGFSNKEISKAVFLAEGTVRNHVSVILEKLHCRDRTQAVLKAIELKLIE